MTGLRGSAGDQVGATDDVDGSLFIGGIVGPHVSHGDVQVPLPHTG